MHVVLKPFPWSPDGIRIENLTAGDSRDFGAATQGLIDEKFICESLSLDMAAGAAEVIIPDAGEPAPVTAPAPATAKSGRKTR